jgi:hypothetical protein
MSAIEDPLATISASLQSLTAGLQRQEDRSTRLEEKLANLAPQQSAAERLGQNNINSDDARSLHSTFDDNNFPLVWDTEFADVAQANPYIRPPNVPNTPAPFIPFQDPAYNNLTQAQKHEYEVLYPADRHFVFELVAGLHESARRTTDRDAQQNFRKAAVYGNAIFSMLQLRLDTLHVAGTQGQALGMFVGNSVINPASAALGSQATREAVDKYQNKLLKAQLAQATSRTAPPKQQAFPTYASSGGLGPSQQASSRPAAVQP